MSPRVLWLWLTLCCAASARSISSQQTMAAVMPRGHFEILNTGHFMALQSPELLPLLRTMLRSTDH